MKNSKENPNNVDKEELVMDWNDIIAYMIDYRPEVLKVTEQMSVYRFFQLLNSRIKMLHWTGRQR